MYFRPHSLIFIRQNRVTTIMRSVPQCTTYLSFFVRAKCCCNHRGGRNTTGTRTGGGGLHPFMKVDFPFLWPWKCRRQGQNIPLLWLNKERKKERYYIFFILTNCFAVAIVMELWWAPPKGENRLEAEKWKTIKWAVGTLWS